MAKKDKKNKTALIYGISGQDGSHLSELLLEKGYEVHGVIRRHSHTGGTKRIDHIFKEIKLHYGDVTDPLNTSKLISSIQPDEVYNLAAQSHVKVSFEEPYYTGQVDAIGTLSILEAVRVHAPNARVYQASTSEMFGGMDYNRPETGYTEESPFHPRSPYGVAKVYSYWMIRNYRESYDMHASNGLLFNHEGERRGETFVTRKITRALANIKKGNQKVLTLGNMDSLRDWGYAKDYVEGMWRMLQQDKPGDYVLATNETHTVREFVEEAVQYCGWEIEWKGEGVEEKGYDKATGKLIVEINPKYFRPAEVDLLLGDYSKAKEELGWEPKTKFKDLVNLMMEHDLEHED